MNDKADTRRAGGQLADQERAQLWPALEHLEFVLSSTGLGVWERDLLTNHVTWSETMYRLYGRTSEHFSGSPDQVLSFVHPDDREPFRAAYRAAIDGHLDSFEQEFRIVRSDGEIRWVARRGQVRRDADGTARSVFGVAMDITERKQAEALDARLATIVAAADDAIFSLSPEGIILSWNPAGTRTFGYSAEEIIGQSVRILYPAGAAAEFEERYAQVRRGEHVRAEARRIRKDGTSLDVSITLAPIVGIDGRVAGVSAVVRDISERKRTEEKLVETLALLLQTSNQRKLALVAGRMATFELDLKHGAITCSEEIYDQIGIGRDQPLLSLADLEPFIYPDDLPRLRRRWGRPSGEGGVYEDEFRIVRPDGDKRWLFVRAQAFNDSQRPAHVYGVSMDITERKEHEAHIRFLMSEISHRSKNLLAVVQAIAAQTARASSSSADFAADFSARLKSLASSVDLLVQQEWRGVSMKELVHSQLGHYGAGSDRVAIVGPNVLLTPLSAQYLGMALHELSTNAVKYGALSGADGRITIEWHVRGPKEKRHFEMTWVERGGPPTAPPQHKGFGHLVIERMVAEALQGTVKLEFAPEGLSWSLDADAAPMLRE
ncbi:MAG TPA: PAS domain S-box protein [Hyphomicrobiaceae bacterium]|nr:PAS domain S-box protein [Hyphomicrobiaceae bacterium]